MELNAVDDYAAQNNDGGGGGAAVVNHNSSTLAIAVVGANNANDTSYEFQTMKPAGGQMLPSYNTALAAAAGGAGLMATVASNAGSAKILSNNFGRTEISHSELVKLLCYLEGELQARDVVIAALRSERVKQFIAQLRTPRVELNDPYAAIFRDKITVGGSLISRESSTQAAQAEMEVRQIIEQQMEQQYQMVSKQRATHMRMVSILTESLENNQRMLQELEAEKRKHEQKTAQAAAGAGGADGGGGPATDEVAQGLEIERNKLRQELEEERVQVKKLEKDLKDMQKTLEYERNRQKQIVLLLIAERKKILMKYIEEGKRSEDLAQILAEEKQRSDTIADGLEEESKKSLRMEEEVEKQSASFEMERKQLKLNLAKEEKRVKDLEEQLLMLQNENEALKKQQQHSQLQQQAAANAAAAAGVISTAAAGKSNALNNDSVCVTPTVNIAKIVQPTATVSSVPVSGPTTGIARSITAAQGVVRSVGGGLVTGVATAPTHALTAIDGGTLPSSAALSSGGGLVQGVATSSALPSVLASTAAAPPPLSPLPMKMQPTATIQRAPGGKFAAMSAAAGVHSLDQPAPHPVPIAVPPVTVPMSPLPPQSTAAGARGVPPPIPPNKPIVPPKREPSLSRLGSFSSGGIVVAGAAVAATGAAAGGTASPLAGGVGSVSIANAAASSGAGAAAAANAKNN